MAILLAVIIVVLVTAFNDWSKEKQFRGLQVINIFDINTIQGEPFFSSSLSSETFFLIHPVLRFSAFGIYGHILDTDRLWEVELSLWLNEKTLSPRSFHACAKIS